MTRLVTWRCSLTLARAAVEEWHYSHRLPAATPHCYGVLEGARFIGVVMFGYGANCHIARPFGLAQADVRELVRVALAPGHDTPTSQVVAACLRQLQDDLPQLRLIVSYADSAQGHWGTIYQAGNWLYLGPSFARTIRVDGQRWHSRTLYQRFGTSSLAWIKAHVDSEAVAVHEPAKHKYVYPCDSQIRRRLRPLRQAYPCAVKESEATRPPTRQERHVRSVLTAPTASAVSCGRHRDATPASPAAPAPRRRDMTQPDEAATRKNVAVKVDNTVHTQLTLLADLAGVTIPDVIREAITAHLAAKRAELTERSADVLAGIERQAAAQRAAVEALVAPSQPTQLAEAAKGRGRRAEVVSG